MPFLWPHPALSKGEGSQNSEAKVSPTGGDLEGATEISLKKIKTKRWHCYCINVIIKIQNL